MQGMDAPPAGHAPDATDTVGDWVRLTEACYPPEDAEDWDEVGLMVGAPEDPVRRVLVSLDVTPQVIAEAVEQGADLVVAHHPLLFRPLARLTPDTASGRVALQAARAGVAVLAAHTNFDTAEIGTSDPAVALLGLEAVTPLQAAAGGSADVKLVTFVPSADTPKVLAALSDAGAGVIGEYDRCSFRVAGTGSFRPSPQAHPHLGERETLNEVPEDRLEVVVPPALLREVVSALWAVHPYEEVAYDVYPLVPSDPARFRKGLGRVGRLPEPLALREVAARLADGLPSPHLRVAGDLDREVRRVAVCGGAGDRLIDAARAAEADVFVTGDLRHHPALDALTTGLALIDAGHYATEAPALPALRERLSATAREHGLQAGLLASAVRTEPWAPWWPAAARHDEPHERDAFDRPARPSAPAASPDPATAPEAPARAHEPDEKERR